MRVINYFGVALVAGFLLGCGGGSAAGLSAAGQGLAEVINGLAVPPDPGAARDATVAGVDVDGNGIRDEIDRWIATKYGDKPGALEAIRMNARMSQKLLMSNPATQAQALTIAYESMDVGGCTGGKLRLEGIIAGAFFNEELIRSYNTRARIDARKNIFALAGMIVRSTNDSVIDCPYAR